ncbi:hypothetical protein MD484_g7012, partial [Candolleomyces efflorescens]
MSRRLDISALLCDDDEPTDRTPRPSSSHTRHPAPPASAPSPPSSSLPHPLHRPRASTFAYPPEPSSSKAGAFVGFDALVHAATVERRRLSGGELAHPQHHLQQPPQHHHVQHQPPPVQHQHNLGHSQLQQQPQQSPPPHHLNQQQPRLSPQFRRSPWQEDQQEYAHPPPRQLQSPLESPRDTYKTPSSPYAPRHPMEDRVQQMRHLQLIDHRSRQPHPQQHDLDRLHRAHEFHQQQQQQQQRERRAEEERLAELERQNLLERQKMEEERRKLEEERMRLAELERQLREKEAARQREDEKREELRRLEEERRREREIAAIREAERREHHRRESELMHKMELQRQQQEDQRLYDMQRAAEMDRRRQQHQLQQQQQQQAAQLAQQEQQAQHHQYAFQHQQHLRSPQQRHYEPPPRIEIPPGPQHPVRKVDQSPPTIPHSQSPNLAHAHPDQRPAKKPRYSDSPSLPPILVDDKDRIARDRERMSVGEIGYGRIESPVAAPPSSTSSSAVPRRPVSGTGVRRPVSVSDLLSPEPQPPLPTPIEPHHPPLRIISREKDPGPPPNHHHRILSPLGRRSPPGSQAGRAKAARKSDEHVASLNALTPSVSASSTSSLSAPVGAPSSQPPPPPPLASSVKKTIPREEQVVRRHKVEEVPLPIPMDPQQRTAVPVASTKEMGEQPTHSQQHRHPTQPSAPPPVATPRQVKEKSQPPSSHLQQQQQRDAYDWLLEEFAPPTPPSKKDHHRHTAPRHTRSPSVPLQRRTMSPVVQVKKQSPSPVVQDEGDNALEQELEELLGEVDAAPKEESMDVDSVVAELVAETLDEEEEVEDGGMRAPYQPAEGGGEEPMPLDDELLSLIDDMLPSSSSMGKRVLAPSTSASSSLIPPTSRHSKQVPPPLRTSESGASLPGHTSPTGGPSSASASSAKLERESMPPPSVAGKKDKEQGDASKKDNESVTSAVTASAASKKKKEGTSTSKKSKSKATAADSMKTDLSATGEDSQATVAAKSRPKAAKGKKAAAAAIASAKLEASANAAPLLPPNGTASSSKVVPLSTKVGHAPSATSRKNTSVSVASRSRSTSVMPGITSEHAAPTPSSSVAEDKAEKGDKQEEEEEEESAGNDDDNRLYCVCKTKYDQERFMIACDRCDEWYHMQCVDMSELVADLVDQFFCPPCIEKSPGMDLHTTYKQRCLWGLKHPDPDSTRACHKPARGAFSKYCSDDCGVKYMQSRIDTWAKKGGKKDKLWDSVKNAEKREGVVVRLDEDDNTSSLSDLDCTEEKDPETLKNGALKPAKPKKAKAEREKDRLREALDQLVRTASDLKKGMGVLASREKLLEMATERAETVNQCGWDQRLCYGDEEWAEQGQSVFDSYEDRGDGDMDVDGQSDNGEGDWWCPEEASCSRHVGWQTTRYKDICKEKEKKEEALLKLSGRETEIRKRLEDIANPQLKRKRASSNANQDRTAKVAPNQGPLTSANAKLANGHAHRSKAPAGETIKKGKKRKAPSS